jgi:hypothetical protein
MTKYAVIAVTLLLSAPAAAQVDCPAGSIELNGLILAKHKPNLYEILELSWGVVSTFCDDDSCGRANMGWKPSGRAILVTTKTVYNSRGRFMLCVSGNIRHLTVDDNGFPHTIEAYTELGSTNFWLTPPKRIARKAIPKPRKPAPKRAR